MSKRLYQTIYKLKRIYGFPADLYRQGTKTVNVETGSISWVGRDVFNLQKVIVLPTKLTRQQIQSISMVSMDKQFVYGGMIDVSSRWFFIDPRDLPRDYEIKRDDWLVYRNKQYEIKEIEFNEFDLLWKILGTELVGVVPEKVINLSAYHIFDFDSQAERGE